MDGVANIIGNQESNANTSYNDGVNLALPAKRRNTTLPLNKGTSTKDVVNNEHLVAKDLTDHAVKVIHGSNVTRICTCLCKTGIAMKGLKLSS